MCTSSRPSMSLRSPNIKAASWQPDCECCVIVYHRLSVCSSSHLFVCLSVQPFVCLSVCLSVSVCPFVQASVCLFVVYHCLVVAVSHYVSAVLWVRQVCFTKAIDAAHISALNNFVSHSPPTPVKTACRFIISGLMLYVDAVLSGTQLCMPACCLHCGQVP